SRRRHTRFSRDWSSDVCSSDLTYEGAGLFLGEHELPDYLPVVLEFASTRPPQEARAFIGETTHILNAIFSALRKRGSPYASLLEIGRASCRERESISVRHGSYK